jgi:hypothetical protein
MVELSSTKIWLGDFLDDFSWSLGDFFTKTSVTLLAASKITRFFRVVEIFR